jgi:hypothetical protein
MLEGTCGFDKPRSCKDREFDAHLLLHFLRQRRVVRVRYALAFIVLHIG